MLNVQRQMTNEKGFPLSTKGPGFPLPCGEGREPFKVLLCGRINVIYTTQQAVVMVGRFDYTPRVRVLEENFHEEGNRRKSLRSLFICGKKSWIMLCKGLFTPNECESEYLL